ncbi:FG-GAP repeat domain-containing protein [Engelhardtia mirabilis]|uniref:FG-GAP repeat domain-containing protein n=1 Tax=Engelhardtia mirabilis TaxID=2528011 RepID=UPI003AF3CB48
MVASGGENVYEQGGVGDVTADGLPDVVISQNSPSALRVFPGDGAGGLGTESFLSLPGAPSPLALFDLDADGVADVVLTDVAAAQVHVVRADGLGGLSATVTWPTSDVPRSIAATGFDGDGLGDVAVGD